MHTNFIFYGIPGLTAGYLLLGLLIFRFIAQTKKRARQ